MTANKPSAQHRAECDCREFHGGTCLWPACATAIMRSRENVRTLGVGFLMLLRGRVVNIPPEAVSIDPQKVECNMSNLQDSPSAELLELRFTGAQDAVRREIEEHLRSVAKRIDKALTSGTPVEDIPVTLQIVYERLHRVEVLRADYVRARDEHLRLQKDNK